MLNCRKPFVFAVCGLALAASARSQDWGVGAAYGSVNNIENTFALDGFKPSEYTIWVDYTIEKGTLLRLQYGSMWTPQPYAGQTVETPTGSTTVPGTKERINYFSVDVAYNFWQDFFTSGIFMGLGGYGFNPQPMPPGYAAYQDRNQTVFGFSAGVEGDFRVTKMFGIALRLTYHDVFANPHRQFLNADAGIVARF